MVICPSLGLSLWSRGEGDRRGPDLRDMPITVAWAGAELQGGRGEGCFISGGELVLGRENNSGYTSPVLCINLKVVCFF